jgi:tetratricopeptide (TPR) repeat protein
VVKLASLPSGGGRSHGPRTASNPELQEPLDRLVARCRSYADPESATEPNWFQAKKLCEAAREKDPINEEVSELLKRIDRELVNKDLFDRGKKLIDRDRSEDALEWFKKLPSNSYYFSAAHVKVDDIRSDLVKRLSQACRNYVATNHYAEAIPRCERYMELTCQDMAPEDVEPPADAKVDLGGGTLKEGEWRPRDVAYLDFLRAREKVTPKAGMWHCPSNEILKSALTPASNNGGLEAVLKLRYPEAALRRTVLLYFKGKASEASSALFNIRADMRLVKLHEQAETLRKNMELTHQLYTAGQTELQVDNPESAEDNFHEALDMDQEILGKEVGDANPSWYRRNIQQDMAANCYKVGRRWADREDRRKACKIWKLGWSFYKGNPELARAVNVCSDWAKKALSEGNCDSAGEAIEYAVEGDGWQQKADAQRTELHCP